MSFGESALVAHLRATAPSDAAGSVISGLLSSVGENRPELVAELCAYQIDNRALGELVKWTENLAPHPLRDSVGRAAVSFFVAQAVANQILSKSALDHQTPYSLGIAKLMEDGADGLFEVGHAQFAALVETANMLLHWASSCRLNQLVVIESPIGNTVPTQLLAELATGWKLDLSVRVWNTPRNDRAGRGRTIADAAKDFASSVPKDALVVLLDDAISGTRFIKMFDALSRHIPSERFLPIAMLFDAEGSNAEQIEGRLMPRLQRQARVVGFENTAIRFPRLTPFILDGGMPAQWASPVIWGESELIAGKRKVNLVFNMLDHFFRILSDFAADNSVYRKHLEAAWSINVKGNQYAFAPGLIRDVFAKIGNKFKRDHAAKVFRELSRERFPADYAGAITSLKEEDVKIRWDWLRDTFFQLANPIVGPEYTNMSWSAINDTYLTSLSDHPPRRSRDHDDAQYVLPYNSTIAALNRRLVSKLVEWAAKPCQVGESTPRKVAQT